MFKPFTPPVAYNDAKEQALTILNQMTIDEKISLIGGHNVFFTKVMFYWKKNGRAAPHRRPDWGCTKTPHFQSTPIKKTNNPIIGFR